MFKTTFSTQKLNSLYLRGLLFFACIFFASTMYAQTSSLSGVVKDEYNEPLIGVSVHIDGTTQGTLTDIDGKYKIAVNKGKALVFSFVGMKTQKVTVTNQATIDITLAEDAHVLAETVVIGYGTAKKADLTGAIGSVRSEDILKQPGLNAVQSVQGKVSGVNIVSNDSPGSSPSVVVRGLGTALGGRNPLYIVDGFPVEDISNISSADILTMDILKDASSASIYGMRAANGVIIITTKKGETGTSKIGFQSFVGFKNPLKKVKMANGAQYAQFYNENVSMLRAYEKDPEKLGDLTYLAPGDQQRYDTDWYEELLKTGFFTNNVASVSGGSKVVDYYLSYNYFKEDGVLEDQSYRRTTIRNNNIYKFYDDRLKFSQNLSVSFANDNPKPYNAFTEAYRQTPLSPTRYSNGRYGKSAFNKTTGLVGTDSNPGDKMGALNDIGNPLQSVAFSNHKNKTLTIQGGIEGEFKVTDYLKVNTRFGATKYISKDRQYEQVRDIWLNKDFARTEEGFDAAKLKDPSSTDYANNWLQLRDRDTFRWIWEGFATFHKTFDKHNVEFVVGTSREKLNMGTYSQLKGYDVPTRKQYWNLGFADTKNYKTEVNQYSFTPVALASYFGRVAYNYDSKYYLSATIRRDGSSIFKSQKNYWGTFPSVGLGWTISNEEFMKDVKLVDHMKIRGTWGELGNQDLPSINVTHMLAGPGSENYNYVFGNNQAMVLGTVFGTPANPISWEVTREWGIGVDYSMLDQRLSGSIDYYNKTNTNMLLEVTPVQNSMYEKDFFAHAGTVVNKGIEIGVNWGDRFNNGLSYEVGVNYSYNSNEVTKVEPNYDGQTGGSLSDGEITKRLQKGQPIYAWWMLEADGIWQSQEEIDANPHAESARPGHVRYKDQNGDGVIDSRDKVFLGSYIPTSNYGIHLGVGYKNFDLSVDGYGVAGNKVYNGLKHGRVNGGENITYDTYINRWTGEGSTNEYAGANRDSKSSSYFLENGAFFRINNITLGYTFKDLVFKGSSLRMYATAQNPFIITGYSGFTPEIAGDIDVLKESGDPSKKGGAPNLTSGVELKAYPTMRSFIFGVNLEF